MTRFGSQRHSKIIIIIIIMIIIIIINLNSSKKSTLSTKSGILSWILVKPQVYETLFTSRVKSEVLKWMIFHMVAFQSSFSNPASVTEA
jgi:hypothetical protein